MAAKGKEITEFVDITPHRSILVKLGQAGYTLSEALAELVDNSIDAATERRDLRIELTISPTRITIRDNGTGMPKEVASKVLQLGFSTKETTEKLGKFGLGLKTACLSLGKQFTIKTSPLHHNEEYSLEFEESSWMKSGRWDHYPLTVKKGVKKPGYTTLIIDTLIVNVGETEIKHLVDEFGIRFGPFIESGTVSIFINKSPCKPSMPSLTSEGKKTFSIKGPRGHVLKGWFGFKLAGSIKDYYGFNTFRKGRLITSYDKIGLGRDSKSKQIVGELYMDTVPVSHNKRQWITESKEYQVIYRILMKFLRDYDMRQIKLVSGFPAQPGRVEGVVRNIYLGVHTDIKSLDTIKPGDILVTGMTRPHFLLQIRRAGAIVTDMGGMLCHAAIVSREFGIPCIVGTQIGTQKLKDGQRVIVDATEGVVYAAD